MIQRWWRWLVNWACWEPTWPPAPVTHVRAFQPLLDCTMIVDEDPR